MAEPKTVSQKLNEDDLTQFQFSLFSDSAIVDENQNLILENVSPKGIVFEVQSPNHSDQKRYLNQPFNIPELVEQWKTLFPTPKEQPNSFIDGFVGEIRNVLTLTLTDPDYDGKNLKFKTVPDNVVGRFLVSNDIIEWKKKEPIEHVNLLLDGFVSNPNLNF